MLRVRSLASCSLAFALVGLTHCGGSSSPSSTGEPVVTNEVDSGGGGNTTGGGGGSTTAANADSGSGSSSEADSASAQADDSGGGGVDAALACQSPAGCGSSSPVCCATIDLNGGTIPACNTDSVSSTCTAGAECATSLPSSCTGTLTVRLCVSNGDCTEPGNTSCCTVQEGSQSLSFCSNATIAAFAGGTCM